MKRAEDDGEDGEVDSTINIKISDREGEIFSWGCVVMTSWYSEYKVNLFSSCKM